MTLLYYLLDNIFIRLGSKLYRKRVSNLIGTNRAQLVADLFLFCYERDFMTSFSYVLEAFNSTSRYLEYLINNNIPYFKPMLSQIYLI